MGILQWQPRFGFNIGFQARPHVSGHIGLLQIER